MTQLTLGTFGDGAGGQIDVPLDDPSIKVDLDEVLFRIDQVPDFILAEIAAVANRLEAELLDRARAKASGDVLQERSGRFLASIEGNVKVNASGVVAEIFSTDAKAHILEYGASLPAHEILPNRAHALRFDGVFASRVQFPGATLAPHPTIHAAFAEMEGEIYDELVAVVQQYTAAPPDPQGLDLLEPLAAVIPGAQTPLAAAVEDLFAPFELAAAL